MWDEIALRANREVQAFFGEDVSYVQEGAEPVTIRGVFEEKHKEIDPDTGVPFYSVNPVLMVVINDLPEGSPRPKDTVIRKGKAYRVEGDRPDGDGGTLLELKK